MALLRCCGINVKNAELTMMKNKNMIL